LPYMHLLDLEACADGVAKLLCGEFEGAIITLDKPTTQRHCSIRRKLQSCLDRRAL
jgi:hypothetical protein